MRFVLVVFALLLGFGFTPQFAVPHAPMAAWANSSAPVAGRFVERQLNIISRPMRGPFEYEEPEGWFPTHNFRHRFLNRTYHAYDGNRSASDRERAAILLLHGSGRTGSSMIDMWRRVADEHNLILIAPDSAMRGGWSPLADSPSFLASVVEHAEANYPIDRNRLFLFGHSAGAVFGTNLARQNALGFRAVAAHAGYPGGLRRGSPENSVPINFFLGEHDHLFSLEGAREAGQSMAENGHTVTLTVLPNHSHWYYADGALINQQVWRFFERHSTPLVN